MFCFFFVFHQAAGVVLTDWNIDFFYNVIMVIVFFIFFSNLLLLFFSIQLYIDKQLIALAKQLSLTCPTLHFICLHRNHIFLYYVVIPVTLFNIMFSWLRICRIIFWCASSSLTSRFIRVMMVGVDMRFFLFFSPWFTNFCKDKRCKGLKLLSCSDDFDLEVYQNGNVICLFLFMLKYVVRLLSSSYFHVKYLPIL